MSAGVSAGFLWLCLKRFVICVMMISYSVVARAYVSGRLDTQLETDQTAYYSRSYIEEQAEVNWSSDKSNLRAGLQFDLRYKDADYIDNRSDQQINQLYIADRLDAVNYTLGRFNRSDLLGFYTLDGAVVEYDQKNWGASFHAGKPLQLEDYNVIDAGRIYGVDLNHQFAPAADSIWQKAAASIGWQKLDKEAEQNYLHWGFSADAEVGADNTVKGASAKQANVFFNGNYLLENKSAESINAGVQLFSEGSGLARLSYTRWNPKQAQLSFKEQFYSVYARGRQTVLQAELFHGVHLGQQIFVRGRKVWREYGNDGYGASAGFEKQSGFGRKLNWQTQWDSLVLKQDVIHSLYLGFNKSITATLRAYFNTALQYRKKTSLENSRIVALQVIAEKMLKSNLFFDFNARYIYDDNLQDEYRVGFRLSYRFDDRLLGVR